MQPSTLAGQNTRVTDAEHALKTAIAQFEAAVSSVSSLKSIIAPSLKQKLSLKKAEEDLADAQKAKQVRVFRVGVTHQLLAA